MNVQNIIYYCYIVKSKKPVDAHLAYYQRRAMRRAGTRALQDGDSTILKRALNGFGGRASPRAVRAASLFGPRRENRFLRTQLKPTITDPAHMAHIPIQS